MRTILKVFVFPLWLIIAILAPLIALVFITARMVTGILSGLALIAAIALFIMKNVVGGIVFLVIALLFSPFGIPALAQWLVEKLYDLKDNLGDCIRD